MAKCHFLRILSCLCIFLLNGCSGELEFEEAEDILSKQRVAIKVYLPSIDGTYIKYKDDNNTIFDRLAAEGYIEIVEDSARPSTREYDQRAYYTIRLTDKLTPYMAGQSYVKIGDVEVAKIMGIKRVPADENLRVVEFTTRFVPNPIGKMISLRNMNMQIKETKCIFEKHYDGWRLSVMPPDFTSRTEALSDEMMPVRVTEPARSPSGAIDSAQAPATEFDLFIASDAPPSGGEDLKDGDITHEDIFSVESAERICHHAALSMAIPVRTVNGPITYYVETADRTNILPYKDKFKRYGHRFCFSVRGRAPGVQMGLSRSILCSIYKAGNDWKYDLKTECSFMQ